MSVKVEINVNKLALSITRARRWLLSVSENLDILDDDERAQYEYTLDWVRIQQGVLDELEWAEGFGLTDNTANNLRGK